MTSDRVLEPALGTWSVAKLPSIAKSADPKAELRKNMVVEIPDDCYLIRVALKLPNPTHAATIVNAVVDCYLSYTKEYKHGANAQLKASLQLQLAKLQNELKTKNGELRALHQKGTVDVAAHSVKVGEARNNGDEPQPMSSASRRTVSKRSSTRRSRPTSVGSMPWHSSRLFGRSGSRARSRLTSTSRLISRKNSSRIRR